jgi:FMN phosphatase YigB (HAD superfamily)
MKIASFDVFDTVLTRVVGDPKAIFLVLGKQLANQYLIDSTPDAFAYARIQAEPRAFRNIGEKYNLHHIYTELAITLGLKDDQWEKILQQELDLESKLMRPIPIARSYIKAARDRSDRVVFVSDMYFPTEFIQEQLVRHQFWEESDRLYVSNEYGKSKATGGLYQELITREGVSPDKITHSGNHLIIDIKEAKKAGLKAQYFEAGNLNRYEEILESYTYATEGLSSAMAGASRLARLQIPVSNSKEKPLRDVAAGVVAPTLVGYVLWILQQARKMGLKRLYFVSRDGQILLEIAQRLLPKLNINYELHYIYGSRLAWNLPALASLDREQAFQMLKRSSWILDATSAISIRDFLARASITPEEISDSLAAVGFQAQDWEKVLSPSEQQVLHPLLDNSKVKDLILQKAAQQQKVLMQYLTHEKLLDSIPKGLIDLGWFGSSYDALSPLLKSNNAILNVGLFFGLRSNSKEDRCSFKKGYFFDERSQTGFASALPEFGIVPLEMFCAADHSTIVGFIEKNEQAYPLFREKGNQRVIDWGLPLVRDTIYNFTENLLLDEGLVNPYADVREASAEVLKSFWLTPSELEATAWGNFPWEKGHSEKTESLAEPYNWLHIAKCFLTMRSASLQGIWTEGSIARSSRPIRESIKVFFRYRRLLSAIKSKVFNKLITRNI